jgi:two-component system, OmpR family, sensor histidine kinase KdpD
MKGSRAGPTRRLLGVGSALVAPVLATVALLPLGGGTSRDYIFVYLAIVAILAVVSGLVPALVAAAVSFLLVDYFFVPPLHTLSIADETDVVNLLVFFGAAGLVGGLGSRRRRAQLNAEALSADLRRANNDLARLNQEQAEAAAVAVRLARTEQQVHVLEETDRLRADLLANVSHEVRTPLATILTGTTGLLDNPALAPVLHTEVQSIVGETRHLARLVSDMLDLGRIEGHALRLHLADVDLHEAIDAAVERLHRTAPQRPVVVDIGDPLEVVADWPRLGQVFDNLLANADRYAPPGSPIRIEAAPGKRSMVVVRIIDRGPGIPADQRERVFERFVRSEDGSGSNAGIGTGLGLAIVRGIVDAHAGRVWVEEPRDGEGGRFAFALPAAEPSAVAGEDVNVDVDE